jgi:hypothetical protein
MIPLFKLTSKIFTKQNNIEISENIDTNSEINEDIENNDIQDILIDNDNLSTQVEDNTIETTIFTPTKEHKTKILGDGNDVVTIMIYMNGSDLESETQSATADLKEIINAGSSKNVNVIIETIGTEKWSNEFNISSQKTQRYKVENNTLVLVDDSLSQESCGDKESLLEFITWAKENYEANRYMLIMWDHGAGPVYGYGYDQFDTENSLTIDEMQQVINESNIYFDFIGMDCCIMSSLEVCYAFYDYCDYMILSEDFEPNDGWYYTNWIKSLNNNSSIETIELAQIIIDDMVNSNNEYQDGQKILSLIDESYIKILYEQWLAFAYENEESLLNQNYSFEITPQDESRYSPFLKNKNLNIDFDLLFGDDYDLSTYYISDIMSIAANINSNTSSNLQQALNQSIIYANKTKDETTLSGLSITLPYGDQEFYDELKTIFTNVGIDEEYIDWLSKFVEADGYNDYYDYDDWEYIFDFVDDIYNEYYDDYDNLDENYNNEEYYEWNFDESSFEEYEDLINNFFDW